MSTLKKVEVVAALIIKDHRLFATQRGYGKFKDFWEFPGGKIEPGEKPEAALVREIFEELETKIKVGELVDTIEYDYPDFHLSMRCYCCTVLEGKLTLLEHESSRWLKADELLSVNWLPADKDILEKIRPLL